eukprot:308493-Alexandrium_andersonii.AAC.1
MLTCFVVCVSLTGWWTHNLIFEQYFLDRARAPLVQLVFGSTAHTRMTVTRLITHAIMRSGRCTART